MFINNNTLAIAWPLVQDPMGVLAILLSVLAAIFWFSQTSAGKRLFNVVPILVFCYFLPTVLTTVEVIPASSSLYSWIKTYLLPVSLMLLVLSLDVPGIIRLGPKAIVMMLAGTLGVVIGGPVSLFLFKHWLPPEAWKGMAALCGSWIGGSANFVALGQAARADDSILGAFIVVDVIVSSIWMGTLLYLAGHHAAIDRWTGAKTNAIKELECRMVAFQNQVNRMPTIPDLMAILAVGFLGSFASWKAGHLIVDRLAHQPVFAGINTVISASTWTFVIVTAIGVILSFSPIRNLEGAGASKIGTLLIYVLVACIGAGADFKGFARYPALIAMGFVWIAIHAATLIIVGRMIRAPLFFLAVGSQANIGGAASAPIVASAFHPTLAPVGVLLAVAGYAMGTYGGLICMAMLKRIAEM